MKRHAEISDPLQKRRRWHTGPRPTAEQLDLDFKEPRRFRSKRQLEPVEKRVTRGRRLPSREEPIEISDDEPEAAIPEAIPVLEEVVAYESKRPLEFVPEPLLDPLSLEEEELHRMEAEVARKRERLTQLKQMRDLENEANYLTHRLSLINASLSSLKQSV